VPVKFGELLVVALVVAGACEVTRNRYGSTIGKDAARVLLLIRNAFLVTAGLAAVLLHGILMFSLFPG
jgi:hypothetical protein